MPPSGAACGCGQRPVRALFWIPHPGPVHIYAPVRARNLSYNPVALTGLREVSRYGEQGRAYVGPRGRSIGVTSGSPEEVVRHS